MNHQIFFDNHADVPHGSTVLLVPPGSDEPAVDERGVFALRSLNNGRRFRLCPVEDIRAVGDTVTASYIESFVDGVRFTPQDVFTPEEAPVDTDFAVFVNGRRLCYDDLPGGEDRRGDPPHLKFVQVTKDDDGKFVSAYGYSYMYGFPFMSEVPLPPDALLVPQTKIGESRHAQ